MRIDFEPTSVGSLDDAIRWLFRHACPEDWLFSSEADLPQVVFFICDMFSIRPSDLCRRMRREWDVALRSPSPRSWRSRRSCIGGRR